jgi:hypothetical protein
MTQTIKFYAPGNNGGPEPIPASTRIPTWYKDISKYNASNNLKDLNLSNDRGVDSSAISIKTCSPTFDAFVSGYYFVMPEDVLVENDNEGIPRLSWGSDQRIFLRIPNIEYPVPPGYHPISFTFRMMYGIKTPPGTSCLITHPLNQYELPYLVPSAIVDTDKKMAPIDIRFVLKMGFEGVIKQGTPLFQVIPFTREKWEMEIDNSIAEEEMWEHEKRRTVLHSYYTKKLQEIKEFK